MYPTSTRFKIIFFTPPFSFCFAPPFIIIHYAAFAHYANFSKN